MYLDWLRELIGSGWAVGKWTFRPGMKDGRQVTVAITCRDQLPPAARTKHIFWQVTEAVAVETTAHFEGVILGKKQ
jgi:hypothetical protein